MIATDRRGDVPDLTAGPALAEAELGFKAPADLETMCRDLWNWQTKNRLHTEIYMDSEIPLWHVRTEGMSHEELYAPSQILNPLVREPTSQTGIVSVQLCIGLLHEWSATS
jgi:hypothetical protein